MPVSEASMNWSETPRISKDPRGLAFNKWLTYQLMSRKTKN
jgi:hypothetical protein